MIRKLNLVSMLIILFTLFASTSFAQADTTVRPEDDHERWHGTNNLIDPVRLTLKGGGELFYLRTLDGVDPVDAGGINAVGDLQFRVADLGGAFFYIGVRGTGHGRSDRDGLVRDQLSPRFLLDREDYSGQLTLEFRSHPVATNHLMWYRLLLGGGGGYRDRNNHAWTGVGSFDAELGYHFDHTRLGLFAQVDGYMALSGDASEILRGNARAGLRFVDPSAVVSELRLYGLGFAERDKANDHDRFNVRQNTVVIGGGLSFQIGPVGIEMEGGYLTYFRSDVKDPQGLHSTEAVRGRGMGRVNLVLRF